jgi:hypothetical protein
MNKIIKTLFSAALLISLGSVGASADIQKGKMLYLKKLKNVCGFNGGVMAAKHTMSEWEHLYTEGKLPAEIKKMCPKAQDKALKEKFMIHYYDFFKEFGSDSGNIPSC